MASNPPPEVGQTVYVQYDRWDRDRRMVAFEVTRIGRKYFYIRYRPGHQELKFCLDTWREFNDGHGGNLRDCYPTREAYEAVHLARQLRASLRDTFNRLPAVPLTLDQLKRIEAIVSEGDDE